jgi:hypothetical protein
LVFPSCLKFFSSRGENYFVWIRWFSSGAQSFSIAARATYSADMFLKLKTVCLLGVISEVWSFSMRPSKYFYDKPLPKCLDPKTILIYHTHPVVL